MKTETPKFFREARLVGRSRKVSVQLPENKKTTVVYKYAISYTENGKTYHSYRHPVFPSVDILGVKK